MRTLDTRGDETINKSEKVSQSKLPVHGTCLTSEYPKDDGHREMPQDRPQDSFGERQVVDLSTFRYPLAGLDLLFRPPGHEGNDSAKHQEGLKDIGEGRPTLGGIFALRGRAIVGQTLGGRQSGLPVQLHRVGNLKKS